MAAVAVAVLVALGAPACSGAATPSRQRSTGTLLLEPTPPTGGAARSGPNRPPGRSPNPGGTAQPPAEGSSTPPGPPPSDGTRAGPTTTVTGVATPGDDGPVGSLGTFFTRASVTQAVIEIDATSGQSLTQQTRSSLQNHLLQDGKKQSVTFAGANTVPAKDVYTMDDLRSLAAANRSTHTTADRVSLYVLVLSGRYTDSSVVGMSFGASEFAVFPDQLNGGLLGLQYPNFEEAVVVHELGHLFGLVNLTGHGAFHEDPGHPGHSKNRGSVMYYAIDSTLITDVFKGGPPRDFDDDDRTEMERIRSS